MLDGAGVSSPSTKVILPKTLRRKYMLERVWFSLQMRKDSPTMETQLRKIQWEKLILYRYIIDRCGGRHCCCRQCRARSRAHFRVPGPSEVLLALEHTVGLGRHAPSNRRTAVHPLQVEVEMALGVITRATAIIPA